ncbi:general stress protein [Rothia sp. LK2588]|uniref:general stress protein n=1 Tax=Rothia sp. LK2588 TaxID=3114369 RepID=UPI0034CE615D
MDQNDLSTTIQHADPNTVPDGELVAYFRDRSELEHAVGRLTEAGFPMRSLFVVGRDITQVEYFGPKITLNRVLMSSALSGAFFGALIGLFTAAFTSTSIGPHLLSSIPLGIVIWCATGLFGYLRTKRGAGSSFAMHAHTIPGAIELRAHFRTVDRARQILGVGQYSQRNGFVPASGGHDGRLPGSVGAPQGSEAPASVTAEPQRATPPTADEATRFVGPEYNRDGSRASGKFGLRIEDPEEYAQTVRDEPVRPSTNERVEQVRAQQSENRYGLRIDDPAEFEKTIRKAPEQGSEN